MLPVRWNQKEKPGRGLHKGQHVDGLYGEGKAVIWRGHGGFWRAGNVLAVICTFVIRPNSCVGNEQGDVIRGWGIWEVIKFLRWSL